MVGGPDFFAFEPILQNWVIEGILRSDLNHRSELTAGLTRKSRRRHTEGTDPQQPAEAPTTGRFIGKGIGRLSGDSGGWRLWKDRRHGFTLRTEHTSYNSSAVAFSSEKAAKLRRCAETQKRHIRHLLSAECGQDYPIMTQSNWQREVHP